MVVVASKQPGARPETIRTRLARFMPTRAAAGWSIGWSAQTERPDEIADEDQLRAAEHLGCYGAAVAHALAQADIAPRRLRVTAETATPNDTEEQTITLEVRAHIGGIEPTVVEAIARRAEPNCAVWKCLAADNVIKIIAIVEEPGDEEVATPAAKPAAPAAPAAHAPAAAARLSRPRWLTLRLGVLTAVAASGLLVVPFAALPLGV